MKTKRRTYALYDMKDNERLAMIGDAYDIKDFVGYKTMNYTWKALSSCMKGQKSEIRGHYSVVLMED